MDREDFKKAIRLSKEELIDWLDEMYEDRAVLKQIISSYEDACGTAKTHETATTQDGKTRMFIKCYANINGKRFEYGEV